MEEIKRNTMKENKYLPVMLGVIGLALIWAIIVTVVAVRFEHKHDRLTGEISSLRDSIRACNEARSQLEYDKWVLQEDTSRYDLRIDAAYWRMRAQSWQELADKNHLKLQPPPYVK